jgi:N-acetylated-alpha-linked acidic dipeptidase
MPRIDIAISGSRYSLKGSPSLAHVIMEAAQSVQHPTDANKTLWDARLERGPFTAPAWQDRLAESEFVRERTEQELLAEQEEIPVSPLGSGSDYTVMLQRLGVASTDMGYASTLSDAVYHYHSIYDSEAFQEKYADPGFHKHVRFVESFYRPLT